MRSIKGWLADWAVLSAAIICLTLAAAWLPRTARIEPVSMATVLAGQGWHAIEYNPFYDIDYRWTTGAATAVLPSPGMGLAMWRITLAGSHESPSPSRLCVAGDCVEVVTKPEPRRYHIMLNQDHPGEELPLTLRSPTYTEPNGRDLGLLVGVQRLSMVEPKGPALEVAVLLTILGLAGYSALRLGGAGRMLALGLALGLVGALLLWQQLGLWRFGLVRELATGLSIAALAAGGVAWWAARYPAPLREEQSAEVRGWLPGDGWLAAGLIGLWLVTRLPLIGARDAVGDLELFVRWAQAQAEGGLGAAYAFESDNMPANLYLLWLKGELAHLFGVELTMPLSWGAALILKFPSLLAELALAIGIWRWSRRWMAQGRAIIMAVIFLLSPPIWINAAWWGQTDAVVTLLVVLSVALLDRRGGMLSWVILGVALLFKLQALYALPLLAMATARRWGGTRLLLGGLAALGVVVLGMAPMAIAGYGDEAYAALFLATGRWPYPTAGAYNIWYVLTAGRGNLGGAVDGGSLISDSAIWILGLTYRQAGLIFVGASAGAIGWLVLRYGARWRERWLALGLMALTLFLLPTQIHERFMSFAFAPLLLAAAHDRRVLAGYGLVIVANTINLLRHLAFFPAVQEALSHRGWAWASAFIALAGFGYLYSILITGIINEASSLELQAQRRPAVMEHTS